MLPIQKQRELVNNMSGKHRALLKKYCQACQHNGNGIDEILEKVKVFLKNIAIEVGPKVMKELIVPFLIKKAKEHMGLGLNVAGNGLNVAGKGLNVAGKGKKTKKGGALKLAGQGKKSSPWIEHCKKVAKEQGLSYKDAMKVASKTYRT